MGFLFRTPIRRCVCMKRCNYRFQVQFCFLMDVSYMTPSVLPHFYFCSPSSERGYFQVVGEVTPKRDRSIRRQIQICFTSSKDRPSFKRFLANLQIPTFQIVAAQATIPTSYRVSQVTSAFSIGSYFKVHMRSIRSSLSILCAIFFFYAFNQVP